MLSIILNLITIAIVGIFALFVYVAYRQRPDLSATPLDIMRDIVGGQGSQARIHKVVPYKRLLYGPMGNFKNYETSEELAPLEGNMSDYKPGTMPWEGAENENFGSRTGVPRTDN